MNIFNKNFTQIILAIIGLEILSAFVTFNFIAGTVVYVIILLVFAQIASKNLFNGLLIAVAELMIGSKGYLFSIGGDHGLSIRLGLFLVLMAIWLFQHFNLQELVTRFKTNRTIQLLGLFIIVLALGIINGMMKGYPLTEIFFDANGYFYLGLLFVFVDTVKSVPQIYKMIQVMLATLFAVSLKIFFITYIIAHIIPWLSEVLYFWTRKAGIGEITRVSLDYSFHRVFFQSQIFSLILIFVLLAIICHAISKNKQVIQFFSSKENLWLSLLTVFAMSSVLISFSRSFWIGLITGAVIFFGLQLLLVLLKKANAFCFAKIVIFSICSGVISFALVFFLATFPVPPIEGAFGLSLAERFNFSDEAAVNSRWNLLPPLTEKIKEGPLLGQGFGTQVTYNSDDPRIKTDVNPTGEYTTYAFEWGYLDTVTEVGVLGLIIFLAFLISIFILGVKNMTKLKDYDLAINFGFLIGLIILSVVHFFTPYLNHPLGLGYLMIAYAIFHVFNSKQIIEKS